jgi:hypothetical protein
MTINEMAEDVEISHDSCEAILTQNLGRSCVSAKLLSQLLTQKQRKNACLYFLTCWNVQKQGNILRVITDDEIWVYGYNPKPMQQLPQSKFFCYNQKQYTECPGTPK